MQESKNESAVQTVLREGYCLRYKMPETTGALLPPARLLGQGWTRKNTSTNHSFFRAPAGTGYYNAAQTCSGIECYGGEGDDGCGGTCGTCDPVSAFCGEDLTCHDCESAVCGVCDEIDVSQVVSYSGSIGGDHANSFLRAEVFDFPITTELIVDLSGSSPCFYLDHFNGQSWNTTSNGFSDGAAMIACWYSHAAGGITCMTYEWYSPDWNVCRTMDWPAGQPVAHMLVSAIDEKRTPVRYFATWPFNDPAHLPEWFNPADIGPMTERSCR